MENYQTEEKLTDEQLDEEIAEKIDGEEVETTEETEEDQDKSEEETSETEDDQVDLGLEDDETSKESDEEETEDKSDSSEDFVFNSQKDAEKSYQNLLDLQKRQATELGEIRKQLAQKENYESPGQSSSAEGHSRSLPNTHTGCPAVRASMRRGAGTAHGSGPIYCKLSP